jgi:hypothetical protein
MSERTDLTTTAPMAPEDVPAELVELAMREYLPGLYDTGEEAMRQALAAVLPVYGAAIIAGAGVEHYGRQVELARSLTTRVYGAALLMTLADEATTAANAGIEPALNRSLATMLRNRARKEGAQ